MRSQDLGRFPPDEPRLWVQMHRGADGGDVTLVPASLDHLMFGASVGDRRHGLTGLVGVDELCHVAYGHCVVAVQF